MARHILRDFSLNYLRQFRQVAGQISEAVFRVCTDSKSSAKFWASLAIRRSDHFHKMRHRWMWIGLRPKAFPLHRNPVTRKLQCSSGGHQPAWSSEMVSNVEMRELRQDWSF